MRTRLSIASVLVLLLVGCSAGTTQGEGTGALADGEVTRAEYRAAVEEKAECIRNKGFNVRVQQNADLVMLDIAVAVGDQGSEDVGPAQDACDSEPFRAVERQWFLQNVPTGAQRDVLFDEMLACLADVGVSGLSHTSSEEDVISAIQSETADDPIPGMACFERYRIVFPEGRFPVTSDSEGS